MLLAAYRCCALLFGSEGAQKRVNNTFDVGLRVWLLFCTVEAPPDDRVRAGIVRHPGHQNPQLAAGAE